MSRFSCFLHAKVFEYYGYFLNVVRFFLIVLLLHVQSFAFELVRDAEIEDYLYDISAPIFYSAGLKKNSVTFYLIKDNSVNAFVYGGSNIFVHTGLIESSNTPNMLQGVIAHELGHIMGAHLVKMQPQVSKALATYAVATLLGIGLLATDSSGNGTNAAIATTLLGQHIAERGFLSFSRSQEAEADRYGMLYLQKSEISSQGMLELFDKLGTMQKKFVKDVDQYSVTHPLTRDRLEYFAKNPVQGKHEDKYLQMRHLFIQAKILAYSKNDTIYTNTSEIFQNKYYNLYYLTYKNILDNKNSEALLDIKELLQYNGSNPFFHETASIIYQKTGDVQKAKYHFEKAIEYAPESLFIKHEFASFLIKNFNDEASLRIAVFTLESLKNTQEANKVLYENLELGYKKLEMEDYYLISRIEEVVLFGDEKDTIQKAKVESLVKKLEAMLKKSENDIVKARLQRIKKIYAKN